MTIADLIESLKTKDQAAEVEFIVVKTDGQILAIKLKEMAKPMQTVLKLFK